MTDLRLLVNGRLYGGWTSVRVSRSLEAIADTFNLAVTERWPGRDARRPIVPGQACELLINGHVLVSGHVDDVAASYDARQHTVSVAGRSRLGDAVDCSVAAKQFDNLTLRQIAVQVLTPFDIPVVQEADAGEAFATAKIEPGQTPFDFLSELARMRGVLLVSKRFGQLAITRSGQDAAPDALELGRNVLSADGRRSARDRFGEYTVLGQTLTSDFAHGVQTAHAKAVVTDAAMADSRYRPKTLIADGPATTADCRRRAEWERNTRFGRSESVAYTVMGWGVNDRLWEPNQRVHVRDDYLQIDGERLIVSVQHALDDEGERTELEVLPQQAFELAPLPQNSSVLEAAETP